MGPSLADLDRERATKIFELIEFFGGYGFNKSHTCAYALVAYQTAYLKTHYPTEFMAALLSSEMDGAERDKYFVDHIEDCKRMGIEVLQAERQRGGIGVRRSRGEGKICFGLGAIKGVGYKAIDAIVKAREEKGPFTSLDDFFERVSSKEVGQGCAETLIKAGAFDCLKARRAQLLAVLPRAMLRRANLGRKISGEASAGCSTTSGLVRRRPRTSASLSLPDIPEMADAERLAEEKKALGFYMSSHPLARHESTLKALPDPSGERPVAGWRQGRSPPRRHDRRGPAQERAEVAIRADEDGQVDLRGPLGRHPAMLWPEEFAKNEAMIKDDTGSSSSRGR